MNIEDTTYIILIVILTILVSILLVAYLDLSKNNKTLKRVEQIRSNIFTKITHEFRTPLTTILGLSRQLREMQDISPSRASSFLNAIERQGKSLSLLVNQLLDITNLQAEVNSEERRVGKECRSRWTR